MIYSNLILTAGHCVYNPEFFGWIVAAEFWLPFMNSSTYRWDVQYMGVPVNWHDSQQIMYDWALLNTTKSHAFPGWAGVTWNQSPISLESEYQSYGYPDGNPTMMTQNLTYIMRGNGTTGNGYNYTGSIIAWNNTFAEGSSGGPWWITPYPPGPYANGVNSMGSSDGVFLCSPYFDNIFANAYAWFLENGGV